MAVSNIFGAQNAKSASMYSAGVVVLFYYRLSIKNVIFLTLMIVFDTLVLARREINPCRCRSGQ